MRERIREGSKVKKFYYPPATPCDRPLAHVEVEEKVKEALRKQHAQLDPEELLHRIRQGQSALAALSGGDSSGGPNRKSLDQYPGQFGQGLLRTLQRRIGEWCQAMARKLVFGNGEEPGEVGAVSAAVPLLG